MLAKKHFRPLLGVSLLALLCLCFSPAQGQDTATGRVWALELKALKDAKKQAVKAPYKHFYVISLSDRAKLTKEQKDSFFKNLIAAVGRPPMMADYQANLVKAGLSEIQAKEFIENWLLRYQCETVYCQDITAADLDKISVFKAAHETNAPLFRNASDAETRSFRWLPNFLPLAVRTGYFDMRRRWVKCATQYLQTPAAKGLGAQVSAGMTNKSSTTYFPGLPPGTYYVSNLVPLETGSEIGKLSANLWFIEATIAPTTKSGAVDLLGNDKNFVEIKDLKAEPAPTFQCAQ